MACTAFHTCFHCHHQWQDNVPYALECPACGKGPLNITSGAIKELAEQ